MIVNREMWSGVRRLLTAKIIRLPPLSLRLPIPLIQPACCAAGRRLLGSDLVGLGYRHDFYLVSIVMIQVRRGVGLLVVIGRLWLLPGPVARATRRSTKRRRWRRATWPSCARRSYLLVRETLRTLLYRLTTERYRPGSVLVGQRGM